MKPLAIAVIVAGLLWSGFWAWAWRAQETATEGWFAERQAAGWLAEYDGLSIAGFPNRLDQTFTGLRLADPETRADWQAPQVQVLRVVYNADHLIVAFPPQQSLSLGRTAFDITSTGLRASIVSDDGQLLRANAEADALNVTSEGGSSWAVSDMTAALLAEEGTPNAYRLAVQAAALATQGRPVLNDLPDSFRGIRADMILSFDGPLRSDRPEIRPRPLSVNLRLAEYRYGALELKLAGALDVTATGGLEGQLTVKAVNWRDILDLAKAGGYLSDGLASTLESGLDLVAGLKGNRNTLDLPLNFSDGRMSLGPVPLGPAPRIRLP